MMQAILVAAVSAAAGALTVPALSKLWSWTRPKKWEPFEPGLCEELPLHPWGWQECAQVFRCPQCRQNNGDHQPPYCAERGGHFHFKCVGCGYEWAMESVAHKKPAEPEKTP